MCVGLDFVGEADAAPFLAEIDEDAFTFSLLDDLHGGIELGAAVAATGAEDVAGEAFAVDADEDGFGVLDEAALGVKVVGCLPW